MIDCQYCLEVMINILRRFSENINLIFLAYSIRRRILLNFQEKPKAYSFAIILITNTINLCFS